MNGQHQQQQNPTPQQPQRDANNPAGLVVSFLLFLMFYSFKNLWWSNYFLNLLQISLLAIAEETLAEFLSKATGTAVDWVQMIGMKVNLLEVLINSILSLLFNIGVCSLIFL